MTMSKLLSASAAVLLLPFIGHAQEDVTRNFTISGGQIYTPGLVILNSPQPGTPMGGDDLHISLDVTTNGQMPLPPVADDSPTQIYNVTVFLSSYDTGRNFTITNGTATDNNSTLGDIMMQQPGSTVKHIDWVYPDCFVGDGAPESADSDRGVYNISIRQNFRLNGEDHYTIFDVPIALTNSIGESGSRPDCDSINNPLIDPEDLDIEGANGVGILFAPGDSTQIEVSPHPDDKHGDGTGDKGDKGTDGESEIGGENREATPEDGLGSAGAGGLSWWSGASWLSIIVVAGSFLV